MIQYLYTLAYPEEPADSIHVSKLSPKPTVPVGPLILDPVPNDLEEATLDAVDGDARVAADNTALFDDENHGVTAQDSNPTQAEPNVDELAADHALSVAILDQDLQVYTLGEKYGIQDLKKKAARHFEKVLEDIDLNMKIFDVIQGVYSKTIPPDCVLREMVTARIYGEIQHWIQNSEFKETLRCEGDFCTDLLANVVKESSKQYDAALATIEHPGYCNECRATLVLKRRVSKRKNANIRKYCARCEPWAWCSWPMVVEEHFCPNPSSGG